MKLRLNNNKIIKDLFSGISTIIDETMMEADSEGLTLKAYSRSHTIFVELVLKSSLFDDYHCPLPESFCVNTITLDNILKRCKDNEALELELDTNLIVRFMGTRNKEFKIKLIDLKMDEVSNPHSVKLPLEVSNPLPVELPLEVTVPTNVLNDSIKDMDSILTQDCRFTTLKEVLFSIEDNCLVLKGDNDFVDITDEIISNTKLDDEISSLFTLESIKNILKSSRLTKECILRLGNDMPLELVFNIDEGSFIKYWIAPRFIVEE